MRLPAFVGGVEMALPHLEEGDQGAAVTCPQLQEVIGTMKGQDARWSEFLAAGSRTAQEFSTAWNSLTSEARQVLNILQEEPSGVRVARVEEAGGSSLDGSTWWSSLRPCATSFSEKHWKKTLTRMQDLPEFSKTFLMISVLVAGCWLLQAQT